MAKEIEVKIKDRTFFGKDSMSVDAFLQYFTSGCDACRIHEVKAMRLVKQSLTHPVEVAAKVLVMLASSANFYHEAALKWYSAILCFLLRLFVTDNNTEMLYSESRNLSKASMTPPEYARELWRKTLSYG